MNKHREMFGINYNVKDRVRIKFPNYDHLFITGTVGGVAWQHIVTAYIVILDKPLALGDSECDGWLAVSVTPSLMEPLEATCQ
jgi:hypothetical protein